MMFLEADQLWETRDEKSCREDKEELTISTICDIIKVVLIYF